MQSRVTVDYSITHHTLDNGLRVVLNHDPLAPGAAVNLWYHVGSSDETPGATGFAHLFEHLMFCGSVNVANSEHLPLVQRLGGQANATTSFDHTNYFETVPVGALELVLWLEADRLRSLDVSQANLDTQREVVKEEKRRTYDNQPYGDLLALMLQANFPASHPYGHPTIGAMVDLDNASLDDVTAFHSRWYTASNAVLTVVSPLPDDQVTTLIERHFGTLDARPCADHLTVAALGPHSSVSRVDVTRDVPRSTVQLGWRTPTATHPDQLALEVAGTILTTGQSSRLNSHLVRRDELADGFATFDLGLTRGDSLAVVSAMARDGVDPDLLVSRLLDEIDALASDGPTDEEFDRVHAQLEREWFTSLATIDARADTLSEYATVFADPTLVNSRLRQLLSVTPDDVRRVTSTWLDPATRSELVYRAHDSCEPSSLFDAQEEAR